MDFSECNGNVRISSNRRRQNSVKVRTGPAQRKKGAQKCPCKQTVFARPKRIQSELSNR